ncbi:GNAT family N-acetyltransferase [Niallia sp. JL1B1071]|uniref:GNAT family N-acetyltransferase n=1 Tax=Niallia tiangongensis TaxID=3237105 RepID=UPI0037DD56BF
MGKSIIEIKAGDKHENIIKLLAYATSLKRVDHAYDTYLQSPNRKLYAFVEDGVIEGCIGINLMNSYKGEIKHIAVSPTQRGKGIGTNLIMYVMKKHALSQLCAETDTDAVNFYKNNGFTITSLGEKYPGVERFFCLLKLEGKY